MMSNPSINDPAAAFSGAEASAPVQEVQVDVTKLNALSPEVISKQATVSLILAASCHQVVRAECCR
jgi:hypothetical protein